MKPHYKDIALSSINAWKADLQLELTRNERGARLTRNRHTGPLYVQKPFYPEGKDCAHIYLLHPPGGLVSGDALNVEINLGKLAHGLVTTPGAAKVYKARQGKYTQQQKTTLTLDDRANLEWFPMEAIVYSGAVTELSTTIQLSSGSTFTGWEITCFGLPASNEMFDQGRFSQRYSIEKNGIPVFIDKLSYSPNENAIQSNLFSGFAGMQSQPVSGFFITGPFDFDKTRKESCLEKLRDGVQLLKGKKSISITYVNDFLIARYLGDSAYSARQYFSFIWSVTRPLLLSKEACSPRIWLT